MADIEVLPRGRTRVSRTPRAGEAARRHRPGKGGYWGGRKPELPHPDSKRYCEMMAERGWTAPTWPREYGGGGLDPPQAKVLAQELGRCGCRRRSPASVCR